MSVGFNHVITLDYDGKITDYQKSFDNNYAKRVKIFMPMSMCKYPQQRAYLYVSINDTFPKEIIPILGVKSETDLNCYEFDLSVLYVKYKNKRKIGLSRFELISEDCNIVFKSQSFRV